MGEPDLPIWERLTNDAMGILTSDPLKAQEIALEALEARPGHPRAQHCMAEALARRGNHARPMPFSDKRLPETAIWLN